MILKELLQWYRCNCRDNELYFGHCNCCGNFIVNRKPFLVPDLDGNSNSSYYYCCSLKCALRKANQVDPDWVCDVLMRFRENDN